MFRIDGPIARRNSSLVLYRSLAVVLSLWRRDRNRLDSYRVSTVDAPEYPIASGARGPRQQLCDSLNCHEESWDLYHHVWSFSPEFMRLRSIR